jgi:hypothetical protein
MTDRVDSPGEVFDGRSGRRRQSVDHFTRRWCAGDDAAALSRVQGEFLDVAGRVGRRQRVLVATDRRSVDPRDGVVLARSFPTRGAACRLPRLDRLVPDDAVGDVRPATVGRRPGGGVRLGRLDDPPAATTGQSTTSTTRGTSAIVETSLWR